MDYLNLMPSSPRQYPPPSIIDDIPDEEIMPVLEEIEEILLPEAAYKKLLDLSHLREEGCFPSFLSPEEFKTLFNIDSCSAKEKLKIWLPFFSLFSSEDSAQLKAALGEQESLLEEIRTKSLKETNALLKKRSQTIAEEIRALPTNKKRLLLGGTLFKPPQLTLKSKTLFDAVIKSCLDINKSQESLNLWSDKLAIFLLQKLPAAEKQQQIGKILETGLLSFFLPFLTKSLFENQPLLYQIFLSPLELARRIAQETTQEYHALWIEPIHAFVLEWIEEEGEEELTEALKKGQLNLLLHGKISAFIRKYHGALKKAVLKTVHALSKDMPPLLGLLFKLSGSGEIGSEEVAVLLEVEKEAQGTFTLRVFAEGDALKLHPQVTKEGVKRAQMPLEYTGVTLNDLSSSFFFRFFSYQAWPLKKEESAYSITDFYQNLLGSLSEKPVPIQNTIPSDSPATTFDTFIQTALFKKDNHKQALFYFQVRLQALIQGFREKFDLSLIKRAACLINQEAEKLLKEGLLLKQEATKIYATTAEILNILTPPAEENPVEAPAKEELLPQELQSMLGSLLSVPKEDRELVEDFLEGMLGEEIREPIANIKTLLNITDTPPPTPVFSLQNIATDLGSSLLGLSRRDIFRPNTLSYVKISFLTLRIALSILFPQAGLILHLRYIVAVVARRILLEVSSFFMPEVVRKMRLYQKKFYAKLLLPIVLRIQNKEKIQIFIEQWNAYLLRKTKLSYSLSSLPLHAVEQATALKEKLHFLIPRPTAPPAARPLLPVTSENLSAANIVENLSSWLEKASALKMRGNEKSPEIFVFLNEMTKSLPVPSQDKSSFWMQVKDPKKCMELVAELSYYILRSRNVLKSSEFSLKQIINLFKAYAIIDQLARRLPDSHLEGYKPNGLFFALWLKSFSYTLVDFRLHSQVKELQAYFEITDLSSLHNDDNLRKLAYKKNILFMRAPYEDEMTLNTSIGPLSSAERSYYLSLLKDPAVREKLHQREINPDGLTSVTIAALIADEKVGGHHLLPEGFYFLRLINQFSQCSLNSYLSSVSIHANSSIHGFEAHTELYQNEIAKILHDYSYGWIGAKKIEPRSWWSYLPNTYSNIHSPLYRGYTIEPTLFNEFRVFEGSSKTPYHEAPVLASFTTNARSQNEIVSEPASFKQRLKDPYWMNFFLGKWGTHDRNILSELPKKARLQLEMIWTDPKDRAARTLAFFQRNLHLLKEKKFIRVFSFLLYQGEALYCQLLETPSFGKALGDFFKEIRPLLIEPDYKENAFNFLEFAILSRAYVRNIASDFCSHFPDYFSPLIHVHVKDPQERAHLLALDYLFLDPEKASPLEKRRAVLDLCQSASTPFHDTRANGYSTILDAYTLWKPTLQNLLDNDPNFRREVLNPLANISSTINSWEGSFPFYTCGTVRCNLNAPLVENLFSQEKNSFKENATLALKQIYGPLYDLRKDPPLDCSLNCLRSTSIEFRLSPEKETTMRAYRTYQEATYIWVEPLTTSSPLEIPRSYWLSEDKKSLLCFQGDLFLDERRALCTNPAENLFDIYIDIANASTNTHTISLDKTSHRLSLLSWFQPLSSIFISYNTKSQALEKITFRHLNLHFNITQDKAWGEKDLSGFYIAPLQDKKLPFSSFLLLENETGQQKIVLPTKLLLSIFVSFIQESLTGVKVSQWMTCSLNNLIESLSDPSYSFMLPTYISCDLERQGNFSTQDPFGLFFLMAHYLMENDEKKTIHYLRKLESFGKQFPYPTPLIHIFSLLQMGAVILPSSLVLEASLRLSVCIEENKGLYSPKDQNNDSPFIPFPIYCIALIMNHSRYTQGNKNYLNDYQELLLLNFIAKEASKLVESSHILQHPLVAPLSPILGYCLEMLVMPSAMYTKYLLLKNRYTLPGENDHYTLLRNLLTQIITYHQLAKSIPEANLLSQIPKLPPTTKASLSFITETLHHLQLLDPSLEVAEMSKISDILAPEDDEDSDTEFLEFSEPDRPIEESTIALDLESMEPGCVQTHFVFYYYLAKGDVEPRHHLTSRHFQKTLFLLNPNDFSGKEKQLIAGLKLVAKHKNYNFPSAQQLKNLQRSAKKNLHVQKVEDFSQIRIWEESYALQLKKAMLVHTLGLQTAFSRLQNWAETQVTANAKEIAKASSTAYFGFAFSLIYTAARVYQKGKALYRTHLALQEASQSHLVPHLLNKTTVLSQEQSGKLQLDHDMSTFLQERLSPFLQNRRQETPLDLQPPSTLGSLVSYTFGHLTESLEAHYKQQKDPLIKLEKEQIPELIETLTEKKESLEKDLAQIKEELSDLSAPSVFPNTTQELSFLLLHPPITHKKTPLDDLIFLFGENRLEELCENVGLKKQVIVRIEEKLFLYLMTATHIHHLEKCLFLLHKGKDELDTALISQISQEMSRKRAYSVDPFTPLNLLRSLLVFEYKRGSLLWKNQTKQLKALLLNPHPRLMLQLPTGSGKTDVLAPIISHVLKGVYTIFPSSLSLRNISQMSDSSEHVYKKHVCYVPHSRQIVRSEADLWVILRSYEQALKGNISPVGTKEDLQALELLFIEEMEKETSPAKICLYRTILKLIRETLVANIDEGHELFRSDKELNYPQGKKVQIPQGYVDLLSLCARLLVENNHLTHINSNEQSLIEENTFQNELVPLIVDFYRSHLKIDTQNHTSFSHYLTDKNAPIPAWVHTHLRKQEIALVRGLIHVLLPESLKKKINVEYGFSQRADGPPYAIPYAGNNLPIEEASIKDPLEATLKTFILYLYTKLSLNQTKQFIEKLRQLALAESRQTREPKENTLAYQHFALWVENQVDLFSSDLDTTQVREILNKKPAALLSYARFFAIPKITYYKQNLRSDSQNFASLFSRFYSTTASPPLHNSLLPENVSILWDAGTEGAFAQQFCHTTPSGAIFSLHARLPEEVLQEVATLAAGDTELCALIDTSALLKGISNLSVAKKLFETLEINRPSIKGVVFFDENNNLKVVLKEGRIIDYDASPLKPTERFTYFDQPHTYGANVEQPFQKALLLGDENLTFATLMQGAGRMRKFMLPHGQKIVVGLSPTAFRKLQVSNNPITAKDLILFTQQNSIRLHAETYLPILKQKIEDVVRRAILDRIIFAPSYKETMSLFREFRNLLITHVDLDPFAMYSVVPKHMPPEEALSSISHQAFAKIQNSPSFSFTEKEEIQDKIRSIGKNGPAPKTVLCSPPHTPTLGVSQQTEQTAEQERQEEEEMQIQLQMHLDARLDNANTPITLRKAPALWNRSIPYMTDILSWFKFLPPPLEPKNHTYVEIYSVGQTLAQSKDFHSLKSAFTGLFWTSNLRGILSSPEGLITPPFGKTQKPILELLVIYDCKRKISRTVALDQSDSAFWRNILTRSRQTQENTPDYRLGIVDITLETVVATGYLPLSEQLLEEDPHFMSALVRWKFLAGHTHYFSRHPSKEALNKKRMEFLTNWTASSGILEMEELFERAYQHQGSEPLDNSDIAIIFRKKTALGDML